MVQFGYLAWVGGWVRLLEAVYSKIMEFFFFQIWKRENSPCYYKISVHSYNTE